jgi:hypothetical protein
MLTVWLVVTRAVVDLLDPTTLEFNNTGGENIFTTSEADMPVPLFAEDELSVLLHDERVDSRSRLQGLCWPDLCPSWLVFRKQVGELLRVMLAVVGKDRGAARNDVVRVEAVDGEVVNAADFAP